MRLTMTIRISLVSLEVTRSSVGLDPPFSMRPTAFLSRHAARGPPVVHPWSRLSVRAQFNYGPPVIPAPIAPVIPPVHGHAPPVVYPPMPYEFGYGVTDGYTGNDFGHSETSDGKVATGTYHVLLPDGRKQIVTYTADYNGFNAKVSYEGVPIAAPPVVPIGRPIGHVPGPIASGYGK
ncbi:hypothetical protein SK128_008002 [Halocaridina rubra]|uniref:Cuticle protein n=1 Tax=Halocaridina rubra TaxID=373956 RepID=A0AAN9FWC4_HALRR